MEVAGLRASTVAVSLVALSLPIAAHVPRFAGGRRPSRGPRTPDCVRAGSCSLPLIVQET